MGYELEAPKRVRELGHWTTLVVIEWNPEGYITFDSAPGWPSIAGLDPLIPSLVIHSGEVFKGAKRVTKLVTFSLGDRGYHVELTFWTLESQDDEFEPCAISDFVEANNAEMDSAELVEVVNLRPGWGYTGGGGAGAEWRVRRAP